MLTLLKEFLGKLDFFTIVEALRKRKNRQIAARLHLILVQSYEIVELYRILLDELKAALKSHQSSGDSHKFYLNPLRVANMLARQSSNLEVMEVLVLDLLAELRILDNDFAETYRSLIPGKFGILFEAQHLLDNGRLSIAEGDLARFPTNAEGEHRRLWFTGRKPSKAERKRTREYFHTRPDERVIEVNVHDGDAFFAELRRYFEDDKPYHTLKEIEKLTERYRKVLLQHFTIEDLLGDIGKVRRHCGWASPAKIGLSAKRARQQSSSQRRSASAKIARKH